eukprot:c3039_g1_i1.p1 GENE.c3039_g1_i1~~c3039_g1_i1.p1  ORF type:complete len:309 (+),score=53.66 c3039_g1_i1:49-927(+)
MSVFVNNIAFLTTDEDFHTLVSSKGFPGFVSAQVSRRGNRSRGFGFVKFESRQHALDALAGLNGLELDGRPLRAREARENSNSETSLFVGNLPWETTSEELAQVFGKFGAVRSEVQKQSSGRSKGFAIVEFDSSEAASKALASLGTLEIGERVATVRFNLSTPPPRNRPASSNNTPSTTKAPREQTAPRPPRKSNKGSRSAEAASTTNDATTSGASLFVGNLPWAVEDDALKAMFSEFKITSASVKKGYNGRSRGYGLVEAESVEEAQRIIDARPEFDYEGRTVFVRPDRRP